MVCINRTIASQKTDTPLKITVQVSPYADVVHNDVTTEIHSGTTVPPH